MSIKDPSLSTQARMSLLSWGKEAERANGAQCGHKGKFTGQGRVGCAISGGAMTTESDGVSQNEAPVGRPRDTPGPPSISLYSRMQIVQL